MNRRAAATVSSDKAKSRAQAVRGVDPNEPTGQASNGRPNKPRISVPKWKRGRGRQSSRDARPCSGGAARFLNSKQERATPGRSEHGHVFSRGNVRRNQRERLMPRPRVRCSAKNRRPRTRRQKQHPPTGRVRPKPQAPPAAGPATGSAAKGHQAWPVSTPVGQVRQKDRPRPRPPCGGHPHKRDRKDEAGDRKDGLEPPEADIRRARSPSGPCTNPATKSSEKR